MPIPVAAPSKAWVCSLLLAGFVGSNSAGGINLSLFFSLSLRSVVCRQVEVSASGRSLVQRSPTECGVPECDQVPRHLKWVGKKWPKLRNEERISFSFLIISYLYFS